MKRLVNIFTLLFLAASAWATTTVTGTMQNLGTGNVTPNAFMRFWLRGCGGNQPRVTGTALIAPSQGGVFYFDFAANASGQISGTLYSTRDSTGLLGGDINCGGSTTAVWYGMQAYYNGKAGPEIPVHAKSGVTLDITQVSPITTNPVVTSPTGDSTYARLDGGNQPFTGNVTPNGDTTLSLGSAANRWNASLGTTTLKKQNNIRIADQFAGADMGAKINAAYADFVAVGAGPFVRIRVSPKSDGSCYSVSTAISFSTNGTYPILEGDGTCLQWTSTTGTMITVNAGATGHRRGWGIKDVYLVGPNGSLTGCTSVSGVTAQALLLGGTNGAEGFTFEGGGIKCFGTAIEWASNTYATRFVNTHIEDGNRLLDVPGSLSNIGEAQLFDHVFWAENGGVSYTGGGSPTCPLNVASGYNNVWNAVFSDGNSFDNAQVCSVSGTFQVESPHFENPNNALSFTSYWNNTDGSVMIHDPDIHQDFNPTTLSNAYFENLGASGAGNLVILGFQASATVAQTYFVKDAGSASTYILGNAGSGGALTNWINHTGTGNYLIDTGQGHYLSPTSIVYQTPLTLAEQAAPSGSANNDWLWADSTAHRLKMNNNNGGAATVASLAEVPQVYNSSGTVQLAPHQVIGTCTLGTNCSVSLSGSAVFTNATSYVCTAVDQTGIFAVRVNQTAGNAFAITGNATDVIGYSCAGN